MRVVFVGLVKSSELVQNRFILNNAKMDLQLFHTIPEKNKLFKRRGFVKSDIMEPIKNYTSLLPVLPPKLVYEAAKLTHSGVCAYKVFENCGRPVNRHSLDNLLSTTVKGSESMTALVRAYKEADSPGLKASVNNQAAQLFDQDQYNQYLTFTRQSRRLNGAQSRKIRQMSEKLAFYSQTRKFTSKKTGSYSMKVAFLTLTTPAGVKPEQSLKAFETFLDYLQRTANCHYVWKKELGDENHHLHYHLLINNFVPYYLISWKWKRALIAQGVEWPQNLNSKDSNSHYRIEIPKSKGQTAKYIAKYLSKAYDLPGSYGYLAGWSRVLTELKDIVVYEGDSLHSKLYDLVKGVKCICRDFVSFYCLELLSCKDKSIELFELFEEHYLKWSDRITLPQKFYTV